MSVETFLMLFILAPLFVDFVLLVIGLTIKGKKIFLSLLVILYAVLNIVAPILVLYKYYLEKIGNEEMIYGIAFIIFFRLLEIFAAPFGRTFLALWRAT